MLTTWLTLISLLFIAALGRLALQRQGDSAQRLNALGERVHDLELFAVVFVE